MECAFCAIVTGEAPTSWIYQDERVISFMDIEPATPGHLLVVPKVHVSHLADLDPEDGAQMFQLAQVLGQALRDSSIAAQGINLFLADGEVAFQDIFHIHLHVVPRTRGDGVVVSAEFGKPNRDLLDAQAADIRATLVRLEPPERAASRRDLPSSQASSGASLHTGGDAQ